MSFGGVIFDTKAMAIQLPTDKQSKGLAMIRRHEAAASISLHDLQQLTGFLNFATLVVPLGRAFLRRLYYLQLYFPHCQGAQRRISSEAHNDLAWWHKLLQPATTIERRFLPVARQQFVMWTNTSGLKGLGGYYQALGCDRQRDIQPAEAFMPALRRHIEHRNKHINTKEMRAVEQVLLPWARLWKGSRVTLHIDNQAVVFGIRKHTMCGSTMNVLRRCLLLASRHDLELNPDWIPTGNNRPADALSRFDRDTITNLAPQLLPLFDPQNPGFLMCAVLD